MISNITFMQRQPLVTKVKQIYASTDRNQSQQENKYNLLEKVDNEISSRSNISLYGYETLGQQSSFLDIRI